MQTNLAPGTAFGYGWAGLDSPCTPPSPDCQQVGMGRIRIGSGSEQMQALLGSCIGIGFLWKKRGLCALAHCLLPEAPVPPVELGARYVSQAVPSMLRLIGATEADYPDIEVVVAGGATMLNGCSSRLQIGQQNADAAQKYLRRHGLSVQYCRVGGKCGRTLTVDCATSSFRVSDIVKTCQDTPHAKP